MAKTKKTPEIKLRPPGREAHPHWVSREWERFIGPVITAVLIGAGVFIIDYVTTDPEIAPTIRTVKQHDELINLLSQSVAQQTSSIKSLATDRAGAVYGGAQRAIDGLEADNEGKPFDAWSVKDQRLYEAAETQLADAEKRLGIQR